MSQLLLNVQVFRGPLLFHWPACPSIHTCGTSLRTPTALAQDDVGGVGEERTSGHASSRPFIRELFHF